MNDLFTSVTVGSIQVPNRLVMAPMTTRLASPAGFVTDRLIEYYAARAEGGVGLVTVELASPHPSGVHRGNEIGVHDDRFVDGLRRLTKRIHAGGSKAGIQIGHAGAHARPDVTGFRAVAPSTVSHSVREGDIRTVHPRPLTLGEIRQMVDWYAAAAVRARDAEFDLVEVQGAHDYLIAQFLSPLDNHRTDDYGGSVENRARFALEVVRAMRAKVGDLSISFRISADEYADGGFTVEDAEIVVPMLVDAGVDLISVSAGSARSKGIPWLITTPMAYPRGLFVPLASRLKRASSVPVAVAGRLDTPDLAEQVVRDGSADLIVLGRALLADPDWVRKARDGDRIRPCIACNTCVDHLRSGREVRCVVNPTIGEEGNAPPREASSRTVVVVGGGPAGLTAATELAHGGSRVVLLESSYRLGGRLNDVAKAPYFQVVETTADVFDRLRTYLADSAVDAGVRTELGCEATLHEVLRRDPDVVVLATGAVYPVPWMLALLRIPGARRVASLPRLRKLFFRLLRQRRDDLPGRLAASGVEVHTIGDRSGSRGVEAAIRSGWEVALQVGGD